MIKLTQREMILLHHTMLTVVTMAHGAKIAIMADITPDSLDDILVMRMVNMVE